MIKIEKLNEICKYQLKFSDEDMIIFNVIVEHDDEDIYGTKREDTITTHLMKRTEYCDLMGRLEQEEYEDFNLFLDHYDMFKCTNIYKLPNVLIILKQIIIYLINKKDENEYD